ncbi:hypothetical protein VIGAN_01417000, partial [Vigna angularis var. angularis]
SCRLLQVLLYCHDLNLPFYTIFKGLQPIMHCLYPWIIDHVLIMLSKHKFMCMLFTNITNTLYQLFLCLRKGQASISYNDSNQMLYRFSIQTLPKAYAASNSVLFSSSDYFQNS